MSLFLWMLVGVGVVNTIAVLWLAATGRFCEPITLPERVIDASYTFAVGVVALWFLAGGV